MSYITKRLETCRSCDKHKESMGGIEVCTECGCVIKLKAVIPLNTCPLKKWDILEETSQEYKDLIINDVYFGRNNPKSAYFQDTLKTFKRIFGEHADIEILFVDMMERKKRERKT